MKSIIVRLFQISLWILIVVLCVIVLRWWAHQGRIAGVLTFTNDLHKYVTETHRLPVSVEEFISWSNGQGRKWRPSRINEMFKFKWCDDETIPYIEYETFTPGEVRSIPVLIEIKSEDIKNMEFYVNHWVAVYFSPDEMSNILYRTKQHLSTNSVVDIP